MRITRISIDGYGRFAGLVQEFGPGLHIVIGPNEQGKSTIRSFIADMLYGQKRSTAQRLYDESNELRLPWENPDCYGGSLQYVRENGQEIEVVRNFDRKRESVQIYDRTNARDITGDFDRLRNREVDFASKHLGLSKDVFLSTATISHFSLEDLGDKDALNQIREKLLSLADSGDELHSSEATINRLRERVKTIGQPNARTKPLPAARKRLAELDLEYERALELQQELDELAEKRRGLLEETDRLRAQRLAWEEQLRVVKAHDRAARLREADNLLTRIDTATQHCFALGAARDFPLELAPEVQRAENRLETARVQLERTQGERDTTAEQLEAERTQLGEEAELTLEELPEEMEERLNTLTGALERLQERVQEGDDGEQAAAESLEEAQGTLDDLPDFSRLSADPVEWLTQLASSFSLALRTREEECGHRDKLREEMKDRRRNIASSHALFKDRVDFPEMAREFELGQRMHTEQIHQRTSYVRSLEGTREEIVDKIPQLIWMTVLCALGVGALLTAFAIYRITAVFLPGAVILLAILYFLSNLMVARVRLAHLTRQIAETRAELEAVEHCQSEGAEEVQHLLEKTGHETIRELEALYDEYREAAAELSVRIQVMNEQEERAAETEERIPPLLERLRETFESVGEIIDSEDDVQEASARAVGRYQEYREAKRHLTDARASHDRAHAQNKKLAEELARARAELDEADAALRGELQTRGFAEEEQHDSATAALRAYKALIDRHRERHGRLKLIEEKLHGLDARVEEEARDRHACEEALDKLLKGTGVKSAEQWHALAEQAKEYREVWNKRTGLEEQLAALLRGEDIKELRESVEADGELGPPPKEDRSRLRLEIEGLTESIDGRMKEEHGLHIKMTERVAGARPINEIEEERAAVRGQARQMEREHEAASYAMALIEDVARDKHARIAPKLAARASAYLSEITGETYDELLISRDLTISIRIPQTNRMNENPEQVLSKGTVDQVYLALRLALVHGMAEAGEPIPMLLDDPFANYDDLRLNRTMALLSRIAESNQVMLFTCRDDVVRAAEEVSAPVIRL